jgi:hypothetical protein
MFAPRFFANRYFAPVYFAPGGSGTPPVPVVAETRRGGGSPRSRHDIPLFPPLREVESQARKDAKELELCLLTLMLMNETS